MGPIHRFTEIFIYTGCVVHLKMPDFNADALLIVLDIDVPTESITMSIVVFVLVAL